MEIKEWLDDSGKQTSVDVTDLGKVLYLHVCACIISRPSQALRFSPGRDGDSKQEYLQ